MVRDEAANIHIGDVSVGSGDDEVEGMPSSVSGRCDMLDVAE